MPEPLVIAYHLIWTAYGCWLPNDPRGSCSTEIRRDVLAELGELHFGRKQVQPAGREIREFYQRAANLLKNPLLTFDASARDSIAVAFAQEIAKQRYTCYACAIMPDHIHIVIRKHRDAAEEMIGKLQEASRVALADQQHRTSDHPIWGGPGWKVFLDHPNEIRRTIRYVELNLIKIGLPAQPWPFVTTYDGWPLHPGHSPNSPYAKRLRELGRYP